MEVRFAISPVEAKAFDTTQLRENFLVQDLIKEDELKLVYTHYDRMIIGGAKPIKQAMTLPVEPELRAAYFLERRELGIINVGGAGRIIADGETFNINKLDCVYIGKGTREVQFQSVDEHDPAMLYLLSAPAHQSYPNMLMVKEDATPVKLGAAETSNERVVYKYIHLQGIKSCQLVMGLTVLAPGSVWNSVPPHTHTRRMEVYFYFDIPDGQRIFHYMGETNETRHIVTSNNEAVISPPWSTHFGCGTANYGFIWGMAGENLEYTDMDPAPVATLR